MSPPSIQALIHYAQIQRQREADAYQDGPAPTLKPAEHPLEVAASEAGKEKELNPPSYSNPVTRVPSLRGWEGDIPDDASQRALRASSWMSCFFLVTTDILGPQGMPWAMSTLGFGPGIAIMFVFATFALLGGFLIWKLYLAIDSDEYPLKSYTELSETVLGKYFGYLVNFLVETQLLVLCAILMLTNGQGIAQVGKYGLCFTVGIFVWAIAGMITGQVQNMRHLAGVAQYTIYLNILIMILTMVGVSRFAPNYVSALAFNGVEEGPVILKGLVDSGFSLQLVGATQSVYSYAGCILFVEFMSEMRRPADFWKSMICAQTFLTLIYTFYSCFIYGYQGQFTISPAFQGVSHYTIQTICNCFSFVTTLVSMTLFANITVKTFYASVLSKMFKTPKMRSKQGRGIWATCMVVFWALAYVVAAGVPQITTVSGILSAISAIQFSYTFPPLLYFGYLCQRDASELAGETFDPKTGDSPRNDTWRDLSRWQRGVFGRNVGVKALLTLYFFACLATCGLGSWSSIDSIIATFARANAATSFGCSAPV